MTIEDNTFDFKVRDCLLEECRKENVVLHYNHNDNKVMIDLITYCSQGNVEEAILNLKSTIEFLENFETVRNSFDGFRAYFLRLKQYTFRCRAHLPIKS